MRETRQRSSAGVGTHPNVGPLDDWLGDISDDDWSEQATERGARRRGTTAYREPPGPEGELRRDPTAARPAPARPVAASEAHREVIERRRLAAGLVLAVVLALAVVIPVLLLRDGDEATVTPASQPVSTTSAPRETNPSPASGTPSTSSSTPPPATTAPATGDVTSFALPEGTKLQREGQDEGELEVEVDPALIRELQQALADAGFDPGPADGTFGQRTEAAVAAFQQANGLSVDGRVGPETAEALNRALARG